MRRAPGAADRGTPTALMRQTDPATCTPLPLRNWLRSVERLRGDVSNSLTDDPTAPAEIWLSEPVANVVLN